METLKPSEKAIKRGSGGEKDYEPIKPIACDLIAQDLGKQEYFAIRLRFVNGKEVELRLQEHQYNHFFNQALNQ